MSNKVRFSKKLEWHFELGNKLKTEGKLDLAVEQYLKILEINPNYIPALNQLSITFQKQKKILKAIKCLENIVELRPQSVNFQPRLNRLRKLLPSNDSNINLYLKIWNSLNQQALDRLNTNISDYPSEIDRSFLMQYFTDQSRYKIVKLASSLTQTELQYIKKAGLSLDYLQLNQMGLIARQGVRPDQEHTERNLPRRTLVRIKTVTEFQIPMLKEGFLYAICPFSGRVIASNRSFLAGRDFCYRFVGEKIFFLITGDAWAEKAALYFPHLELIIVLFSPVKVNVVDSINSLKSYIISHWKKVHSYIQNTSSPGKVIVIKNKHFAHHLWNDLSGIQKVYEAGLLKEVDCFIFINEPLGDIDYIFPEIPSSKVKRVNSLADCANEIIDHNYFIISMGHAFIKEELANRVYQASYQQCSPAIITKIKESRNNHSLLFWASLRLGKRTWISQAEGLANIIKSLSQEFSDLGVVIDGFSLPAIASDLIAPEWIESIEKEQQVLQKILSILPSEIKVYSTIGSTIHESIVWANQIDFYLAHQGSIQHKVGWFANKPGVIHTKTAILKQPFAFRPGTWERENGIKPIYISESYVTDIREKVWQDNKLIEAPESTTNYECQWQEVYKEVLKIAKYLKTNK